MAVTILVLIFYVVSTLALQTNQFCKQKVQNRTSTTTTTTTPPTLTTTTNPPTPLLLNCPPSDVTITSTLPSFQICLRPTIEKDYISQKIRETGLWEPVNTARIVNILSLQKAARTDPDVSLGVVIDIGAHLGWYTLLAASHGFSVVAFEPLRAQRERLQASVLLNGFEDLITIMPYAVSNVAGTSVTQMWTGNGIVAGTEMHPVVHSNTGGSWIKPMDWTTEEAAQFASVSQVGIDTVLLDAALNALGIESILLIKADIEGHLGLALAKGTKTLDRTAFLFLEITPKVEAANGCNTTGMIQMLFNKGFRMCFPPKCMKGTHPSVCQVEDVHMLEGETCMDGAPIFLSFLHASVSPTEDGSEWVWAYEDVLLAKVAAPSL